jgi:hypothetical protein
MADLARIFIHIAFLRRGPQDVPASVFLLVMLNLVTLALYAIAGTALDLELGRLIGSAALMMALTLLLTGAMLSLASRPHRFVQTAVAIAGAELMLAPLGCVFLALEHPYRAGLNYPDWLLFAEGLFVAWDVAIIGHVYRSALERSLLAGILLSVACAIIVSSTVALVFPAPTA